MKIIWNFLVRWFLALTVGIGVMIIAFITLHTIYSFLIGAVASIITLVWMKRQQQSSIPAEENEAMYRQAQMREIQMKLKKIRRTRFKMRSLSMLNKTSRFYAAANRVVDAVNHNPVLFRQAQTFFVGTLDSAVTITEKYVQLTRQSATTIEMEDTIKRSEKMMGELADSIVAMLHEMVNGEVVDLDIELKLLEQQMVDKGEWEKEKKEWTN